MSRSIVPSTPLGAWIRRHRKGEGWTQAQLAEKLAASQGTISQWETGKADPGEDDRLQLEKLFGEAAPSGVSVPSSAGSAASGKRSSGRAKAGRAKDAPAKATPAAPKAAAAASGDQVPPRKKSGKAAKPTSAGPPLGFENKLWQAVDALRNNMDAAEYKHVVLGLIFLKYISDAFEAKHAELQAEVAQGADPEDPDEYRAVSIFWVPPEARWGYLKKQAPQPTIGQLVDDAIAAIERDNESLKGVLPKNYARPGLDKKRLGQLINLVSDIGLGSPADRARDVLGRVYEYFLSQFASAEGNKGGQFYTPSHVVRVLVEMLAPRGGRLYDPCCGSGGLLIAGAQLIESQAGRRADVSIYGQESNEATWQLAKMNLAIHGIDAQIAHGDSLRDDRYPDLEADYVLADPPFNDSDWCGVQLREDPRWVYGTPPAGNANFAWVQHFIHHLAPSGLAGFVLTNGSMSSGQPAEERIRRAIVQADLVDCMVALPGQLFDSTQIPACLWFLARNKADGRFRDRRGECLFLDARKLGTQRDRTHRELTDDDIATIAGTYHAWRGDEGAGTYEDVPGFCKAATVGEIEQHGHLLTPGRYVGTEAAEEDGESFEERMQRLVVELGEELAWAAQLEAQAKELLAGLGYTIPEKGR